MTHLIFTLLLSAFLITASSFIIHSKGPTHRNFAIKCIKEIAKDAIEITKMKYSYYSKYLLTYVITRNLKTPAYKIQQELLKFVHSQEVWSIEVLKDHRREFESYEDSCHSLPISNVSHNIASGCLRKPVQKFKTLFYIMIVENFANFVKKFEYLTNSLSFNARALYLIYISNLSPNNSYIAKQVALHLGSYSAINSIVMIPKNLTTFDMYQIKIYNEPGNICYSKMDIEISHQCNEGTIPNHINNLFKEQSLNDFHNYCILNVHAIPYEPFVIIINETIRGIEIDVINELGKALNISFNIIINEETTSHLGDQLDNGTWTGFVAPIYNSWDLGIGNIAPQKKYLTDFTYSVGYYSEKVVWVVPIAALIPRWRVLMVIFTLQMWGICLAVIFGFAIFFYFSKTKKEVVCFRTFEKCVAAAFEILIAMPVPRQPITHFTRVFFIALAVFGIIMNSIYTSSLVYYLQNPIREKQISTNREIATSALLTGGPSKYTETFNNSNSPYAKMILKRYQIVNDNSDTYMYWLDLVGNKRNMATIAVRLCVNYLISRKRPIVVDSRGEPKVFILPNAVMTYSIGIMMRRGEFAKEKLNLIIQRLILEAGIINKIKSDYIREGISEGDGDEKDDSEDDDTDNNDADVAPLSLHHLEGAFAILALGHGFGIVIFILEVGYAIIKRKSKKD